jgi:hypothetical protein
MTDFGNTHTARSSRGTSFEDLARGLVQVSTMAMRVLHELCRDRPVLNGRALALTLRGYGELVLENLALRQQLRALKRTTTRPHLQMRDRLFGIA